MNNKERVIALIQELLASDLYQHHAKKLDHIEKLLEDGHQLGPGGASLLQKWREHQRSLRWDQLLSFLAPLQRESPQAHVLQGDRIQRRSHPLYLLLHNLRSAHNVGSILRSAEALGAEKIYFSGYTPTPAHPSVRKCSQASERYLPWEKRIAATALIAELKDRGVQIIACETSTRAQDLQDLPWDRQRPLLLLLGSEKYGLDDSLMKEADHLLRIPLIGAKNSLNVSVCAGIILHHFSSGYQSARGPS